MIYFLGDVHGNFEHVRKSALAERPDAVVFLGDIEAQQPFELEIAPLLAAGIDVRWIHGNHDTDTKANWENLAGTMPLNIDGQVVEIAGARIAGLGGVFRSEIWYPDPGCPNDSDPRYESYEQYCHVQDNKRPKRLRNKVALDGSMRHFEQLSGANAVMIEQIRYGKELMHLSTIFWDIYEKLWEQRADILVTHEAPSCHRNGFSAIDELAQSMGVPAGLRDARQGLPGKGLPRGDEVAVDRCEPFVKIARLTDTK